MGGGNRASDLRAHAVAQCTADIQAAHVVSLDLEFSGLFLDAQQGRRQLSLEDYFAKCIDSIPKFLPLQLGLCCCRQRTDGAWELRAHEFNLHPDASRRMFVSDFQSLQFLRSNGFDFNAFFDQGYVSSRMPAPDTTKTSRSPHLPYATQVMRALSDAKVPLVVHNGLLDILHVYTNFIDNLPRDHHEFRKAWLAHFPLLFDTRHIAQEGRYNVLQHAGGLTLEQLHAHLTSLDATNCLLFERLGPLPDNGQAHGSSGFDAVLTAEVFLMEMELWLRSAASESARKRHRKARMNELEAELAPLGWQAIHERALAAGVSICKSAVPGRFGGATGARRKVPEIRADIISVEYAKELDDCRSAAAGMEQSRKRCHTEVDGSLLSLDAILSSKVCRRFHNCLAIVGSSPGCLHLEEKQAPNSAEPDQRKQKPSEDDLVS